MFKAYYTASRKVKFVEVFNPAGEKIAHVNVTGKVEARKVAQNYKATCWNF